jgi:hypothetical protein
MKLRSAFSPFLQFSFVLLALLAVSGTTSRLAAQSFRGGIRGEITDAHGLHVAGAKVVARNLATSETREVTADADGNFRFVELPAGEYEVSGPSTFDTRHRWTTAINYDVPEAHFLPHVLGTGWQLNSIFTVQSGRPINIITGNGGVNSNFVQRPDIIPGVNPILPNWSPDRGYLNPLAFAFPAVAAPDPNGYFGDLGRDQIYGPSFVNFDFSTTKNFPLRERLLLQFRAEFFNIFNRPNFALPSNVITPGFNADPTPTGAGPAGTITQTPDVAQGNPGLGGGGPRVMQFGLRLQF